jgi:putative hemolysin
MRERGDRFMAGNQNGTADASGRPRTSVPTLRELLGDFSAFPVFQSMAVACTRATHERQLAWPMSIPFPVEPFRQADFAQLAALYCNHLGYLLSDERRDAGGHGGLLAFFAHALACYATALPAADAAEFQKIARARLLASMKIARRDDSYWHAVEQDAERRLSDIRSKSSSSARELSDALIALPALHARPASEPEVMARHLSALYTLFETATRP